MAATKTKMPRLVTPQGNARFPKLIEPDEFKGTKKYKVDLVMSPEDAEDLKNTLQPILEQFIEDTRAGLEEAVKNADNARDKKKATEALETFDQAPVRDILEEEYDAEGNLTGNLFAKFNTNYSYTDRRRKTEVVRQVQFFDASQPPQKITPDSVGPGSVLKINYSPSPYFMGGAKGLSLKINAVQIISLSGGFNASADELGFEGVEGGFVGDASGDQVEEVTVPEEDDHGNPDF